MLNIARWGILIALLFVIAGCSQPAAQKPAGGQTTGAVSPPLAPPSSEGKKTMAGSAEIGWNYDYADGLAKAKAAGKPVMIDVFAAWCQPCKFLDETVFSRADVAEASKAFVTVRVDSDKHPDIVRQLKVSSYPTVVFMTPEGKEIGRSLGAVPYQNMLDSMAAAQRKVGPSKRLQSVGGGSDL
jgi:thiol:disulfide interchange protein